MIGAYIEALDLQEEQIFNMRDILRRYGNMSSLTVLFVLREFLQSQQYENGKCVLSAALGPGFSSEMFLARSC